MDQSPGLSISKHTIWFTKFPVFDSDGQTDAYLRVDYDGDLEMIVRGIAYRGRIKELEFDKLFTQRTAEDLSFQTVWDNMDSGSIQHEIHNALQEMPPEVLMRLQV